MIQLKPHSLDFSKQINELFYAPEIQAVFGLPKGSLEDTKKYIKEMIKQEKDGRTLSRLILNNDGQFVGVTTIKDINTKDKTAQLGTWIGLPYWGKGYNQASKHTILEIAFNQLKLKMVFLGTMASNIRSLKSQDKIPYITKDVGEHYPLEVEKVESVANEKCILHVVYQEDFTKWFESQKVQAF